MYRKRRHFFYIYLLTALLILSSAISVCASEKFQQPASISLTNDSVRQLSTSASRTGNSARQLPASVFLTNDSMQQLPVSASATGVSFRTLSDKAMASAFCPGYPPLSLIFEKTADTSASQTRTKVLEPKADGKITYESKDAVIDASHTDQGYVCVAYSGSCKLVRLQISTPKDNTYDYVLAGGGTYETFPLTEGSGTYTLNIYENVEENTYSKELSKKLQVKISDEFLPFLYPNQYVNFTAKDQTVKQAEKLAKSCETELEIVTAVYDFVIDNISYDTKKAETVTYGYLPDNDETLKTKKGICFDYASLMTAMLRSQQIPVRLEVGYAGDAYHAWISVYTEETGWINNMIEFDKDTWEIMDPTFADNQTEDENEKIKYTLKYMY